MAINYLQRKGDTARFLTSWTSVTEKAAIKRHELDKPRLAVEKMMEDDKIKNSAPIPPGGIPPAM